MTNKTYTYIAVGIVLVVVAGWGIYEYSHQNSGVQSNSQQTAQQVNDTPTATPAPTTTSTGSNNLAYGAAVKAYPERFQFSNGCQGTPATIAVKQGTPVMLDNRNTAAHTIKADTQTFNLAGYGYAVFYPKVLGNIVVNCDGKPSVTLNVEK